MVFVVLHWTGRLQFRAFCIENSRLLCLKTKIVRQRRPKRCFMELFFFLNKSSNQTLWHLPWHSQIVVHEAAVISFCSQSTADLLLLLFLLFSLFISLNNTNYLILTFTQTHSLSWPKAHSVQLLTSPGSGGMTSPYHLLRAHGKGGWGLREEDREREEGRGRDDRTDNRESAKRKKRNMEGKEENHSKNIMKGLWLLHTVEGMC